MRFASFAPFAVVVVVVSSSAACDGALPPSLGGRFGPGDFVSDRDFADLRIEVDAIEGRDADRAVYDRIEAALDGLKNEGALEKDVVVFEDDDTGIAPLGDEDSVHTFDELEAAHDDLIDVDPEEGEALMHLLWVDGGYEDDDAASLVLGFAYGGDRIAMLQDNIQRACRARPFPDVVEDELCERTTATVLLHEMGHLFGLVNNGAPMQRDHQDEERGAHDENEDCIMYFAAEGSTISDVIGERLTGGNDDDFAFDDNCKDDLRALADEG